MKKRALNYLVRLGVQKVLGFLLYCIGAGFAVSKRAWVYFALLFLLTMLSGALIFRASQETLAERGKVDTDSPKWDKALLLIFWLLAYFVIYLVAGWEETGALGLDLPFFLGIVLVCLGGYVTLRATLANTYLESTARLQTDRGQTVCQTGPYAVVRHPAYASVLVNFFGVCVIFPTPGVIACAGVIGVVIVIRTILEDNLLQKGLPGYRAYAEKVRFRLIPYVW